MRPQAKCWGWMLDRLQNWKFDLSKWEDGCYQMQGNSGVKTVSYKRLQTSIRRVNFHQKNDIKRTSKAAMEWQSKVYAYVRMAQT